MFVTLRFVKITEKSKVHSSELYSKEWCDLVFEGRNKAYGAYRLRERVGVRYRYVLIVLFSVIGSLLFVRGGFALYIHFVAKRDMKEAEDLFARKPSDLKEGYKVHFMATARQAPSVRMKPGAKSSTPKIVDGLPPLETIGVDGPIDYDPKEQVITTPIVDTTGLHDETLPVVKQKIVPTDKVSQMPGFPGGLRAFMKWMNDHVVYPKSCVDRKQQGSVTVSFIVNKDGTTSNYEVKNSFDIEIYRTVLNTLKHMPKWTPGTDEHGDPTIVKITLPIDFKIS